MNLLKYSNPPSLYLNLSLGFKSVERYSIFAFNNTKEILLWQPKNLKSILFSE